MQVEHKTESQTDAPRQMHRVPSSLVRYACQSSVLRWSMIAVLLPLSIFVFYTLLTFRTHMCRLDQWHDPDQINSRPRVLLSGSTSKNRRSPFEWLRQHSSMHNFETGKERHRPKAAIISLVRDEELDGILQSMRQLEYRWNRRYNYPWMFFSETPFSEDFKNRTAAATNAPTSYHLIPVNHWRVPSSIDKTRFYNSLDYLGLTGVGKSYLPSYRSMCRWNSLFFYLHPALASYEYYWRVEPDVHFFCDIPYDPFRFLKENGLVYGWNMNILDDARSFASLWERTRKFLQQQPELVHADADLNWLIDEDEGGQYNNCQFFSNFEIGSLDFFRGKANMKYMQWLDSEEAGNGFFYERLGDAPVHTLSVAMFAAKNQSWFFRDIGYQHDIARHCPGAQELRQAGWDQAGKCDCERTSIDENFYKLVPMESPQGKPADTCVRMWLGGEWLRKKEGWDADIESSLGGSGYGGYVKEGGRVRKL